MREAKEIEKILSYSAKNHLSELLFKCDTSIDSITLFPNQKYILDLVLLQMFGYLEKKFQDYLLYIAVLDPYRRFHYYNSQHKIEFNFKEVFAEYKREYKVDDKAVDCFIEWIKPKLKDIKDSVIKVMKQFSVWQIIKCEYFAYETDNLIDLSNNQEIYDELTKLFNVAYDYRNTIAHNTEFEYKHSTRDFALLNDKHRYCGLLFYFFIIITVDNILNALFIHYKKDNLLEF